MTGIHSILNTVISARARWIHADPGWPVTPQHVNRKTQASFLASPIIPEQESTSPKVLTRKTLLRGGQRQ